jgi:hypothetical protein
MQLQLYFFIHLPNWRTMCNINGHLQRTRHWAEQELNHAQLGDQRRTRRLITVTTGLALNPHGTLPASFPEWKDLRAAYRLLAEREVTHGKILAPHFHRVAEACRSPGQYLLVEDTTTLSFNSHAAAVDLGPVNDQASLGILVHNTLVLRVSDWDRRQVPVVTVLGLANQQCWTRPKVGLKKKEKSKAGRLQRQRESARWADGLQTWAPPPSRTQWIYVADRESDIYEVFSRCEAVGADWVIRAAQARALMKDDRSVLTAVAQAPVRGYSNVELRARAGQPARTLRVALRALTVTLRGPWRPKGPPAPCAMQVVEVREVQPPSGQVPLVWVLLTSLPISTLQEIKQIVGCYTQRWLIEEYHKALKSGTQMEASQLGTSRALQGLCAILSLVALRLLNSKLYARAFPNELVPPGQFAPELLELLAARWGSPTAGWTQREVWRAIAHWGGFLGRKGDGEPGWQTIWRGWRSLMAIVAGIELLQNKGSEKCG